MAKEKKPSLLSLSKLAEDPNTASPTRELCVKCTLFTQTSNPFLNPPVNPKWTGKLLLLGEAPGREEERTGRFFVGKAGENLRNVLREGSFTLAEGNSPTDAELWNSVRCRPKNNQTPSMEQIRCCRPYVLHRIQTLKPQVVLALGAVALKSLLNTGDATITTHRGRPLEVQDVSTVTRGTAVDSSTESAEIPPQAP